MNEAGYVVCATCGDYAVDFNAVMLDCSTCENSYHHTCVGMDLSELGRRMSSTNAMRKSKGKKGGADGDGDVTGTLYDWICPDCHQQQQPRVPEPDKEEVLVIEDTDDEDEDDGERTTYIDLSYNVDIHRVAPSQRALLPTTTTSRRPAVHMQNVAGLLNRSNVGASTSASRASNSNSNIGASTSTSKPVPASTSTSTSTSPQSHNATMGATTTRNVQTPLSPPPSRSPSRTGPIAPVPFVDFTAMATSSKKRRRSFEAGEGGLEDERAKKKSRVAGPVALVRTPVEPIDLTLSDDDVGIASTPAAPSTSSRRDAPSVSSAGSRSRHGPGSVSSGTTDIATEDEPVPTRNLMRASLAGRTPRVPLPLASSSITRPMAPSSTTRPAPSSRSTVPSKRRLSASPSNSHPASVRRAVVQNQEQEDDGDEEHAFFRSRRTSGVGLTRTRSDAAVLPLPGSTSTAAPRSTVPTRSRSDGALSLGRESTAGTSRKGMDNRKTTTAIVDENDDEITAPAVLASSTSTAPTPPLSSRPSGSSSAIEQRAVQAVDAESKKTSVAVDDVDIDDLPDYLSDEEREHERESTALPAPTPASRVPPTSRAPSARPTPSTTTSAGTTTFRRHALPPPRVPAAPSNALVPPSSSNGVPVHSSTSTSQSQPLFLPDSPSPSPERRERERLMSLPPISFLDDDESETGTGVVNVDVDMDELEDEDELELRSGSGVVKKKKKRAHGASTAVKEKTQLDARPADDAVVKKKLFDRTATGSDVPTERRTQDGFERGTQEEPSAAPSYAQQLDTMDLAPTGLSALLDRTHVHAESSVKKKKKHREREGDTGAGLDPLARPVLALEKMKHADAGEGDGSVKKKKKHRDRDRDALDGVSGPLEKKNTHRHLGGVDVGGGDSSTSGSAKEKKHRGDAVDPLVRPALDPSASLEEENKRKHLDTYVGEGESSTSGSMKDKKKKKHREQDQDAVDPLARSAPGLSSREKTKRAVLGADADAGESSTSSSVKKKKKKHRERERDAAEGVVDAPPVPSQKTPTFNEPATPDRRVGDLTVSWSRLQELASFSPSNAKKIAQVDRDVDGDSFPSTVREEASSSRQLGRKTARPPLLLDDSPLLTLDKRSAARPPLAVMSAERVSVARFPAAGAVPSSAAPASSSSSAARPAASISRPDVEKQKQKEKQPMQTQRARKTVSRREDQDDAPAPSSFAVPERTKGAAAPDKAHARDAPGKGKSTLDKYSARAVASSSSTVLPPSTSTSTSTLPPVVASSSSLKPAVPGPSSSRPSAPSTAPSSSRSKHRVADPSLPFEAPVVPRRKAIAGVDYPLPDLPVKPNKKATARKVPRTALVSDEETPMDVDVDVDARMHTSRKGKEKEQAISVDDDSPPPPLMPKGKEKSNTLDRPKPPPIPRLRSASIWSSSTPTPAPYTTSSPSLDAVTAFLKKRRMANPLPSSSTLPPAPTQGQKMAATKRRLERGEHESDLPVPMSVLANAREMQTLRRMVKRGTVVKNTLKRSVGEVKTDVVRPFDWAQYRVESDMKEKERDEQGLEDFETT